VTFAGNDWRLEHIVVGDRTIRITHIPTRTVAHGRDEADAWVAIARALARKVDRALDAAFVVDFDTEAKRIALAIADSPLPHRMGWHTAVLAETFRLIWNARGSADIATLQSTLTAATTTNGNAAKILERAIQQIDR
jgi:hypothetical protein